MNTVIAVFEFIRHDRYHSISSHGDMIYSSLRNRTWKRIRTPPSHTGGWAAEGPAGTAALLPLGVMSYVPISTCLRNVPELLSKIVKPDSSHI